MPFRIVLSGADLLKNSIPIIAEIVDEAVLNIEPNGISLLAPDRTMVSVVDFKLLASAFDEYRVEGRESLGLNLTNLAAIIKRLRSEDKVILESAGKERLRIRAQSNGERTFEIPLLEVKAERPPIEQLAFSTTVELESDLVEDGLADAEIVSDAVVFEASPDSFRMTAKGETSTAQLELRKGSPGLLALRAKESTRAIYPLEYLKKMVKAAKLSKQAVLEWGNDYPLRLTFKVIDKVSLSFVLAPRVAEE